MVTEQPETTRISQMMRPQVKAAEMVGKTVITMLTRTAVVDVRSKFNLGISQNCAKRDRKDLDVTVWATNVQKP